MPARYALFFVPRPETALAAFGKAWLEADDLGVEVLDPALHRRVTATPRRYGFHATLKAPFRLAAGQTSTALREAVVAFAQTQPAPAPLPLALRPLSGFLALVPAHDAPDVAALAQACVEAFEAFRAPLNEAELQRRRASRLTERQDSYLQRWGYPYVAEEFRFHMTLTDRLSEEESSLVEPALSSLVSPLIREPLRIDAVALVHQEDAESVFTVVERFSLSEACA